MHLLAELSLGRVAATDATELLAIVEVRGDLDTLGGSASTIPSVPTSSSISTASRSWRRRGSRR
ncbi:MAG: hypothetical protein ACXWYP_10215 [Pseudonocardia sp.]